VEISGPTLSLRPPTSDDAEALMELGRDPEVVRWFSWGPYRSIDEPLAYIAEQERRRAAGRQLDLLMVHREEGPVGITGLSEIGRRDRRAMIGTWFGRRWWGSGLNFEAKAAMAFVAFSVCGYERLGAYADVRHERSQRALEKVGFTREGVLRGWHRHGDEQKDVAVYGLLRAEWEASPLAGVPVSLSGEVPAGFVVG
jgi:ribosomal-protein-alanine N-acetyltransferase